MSGIQPLDVRVTGHGSLMLFTPLSERACELFDEKMVDAMQFGGGYVVEPRYALPILEDLAARGLAVTLLGKS